MNEPAPRPTSALLAWLGPALVHAALVGAIVARLVWAGPRFTQFYRDMKMNLPSLTQAVLAVSAWVIAYFPFVVAALSVLVVANAVALWLVNRRSPAWARRWFLIGGAVLGLAWATLEAGHFLPMLKLYQGLSRQP
jgi:type II secretory pathway component PulF